MSKRNQQSSIKRFFASRLFLVVTLVVVVFVALSYARAYYQDYKVRQQIEALQKEVRQLERKRLESMDILRYVTSDAFVEERARTELNLKKPGEHVIYVYEETTSGEAEDGQEVSHARQTIRNPLKWWYYFTRHQLPE